MIQRGRTGVRTIPKLIHAKITGDEYPHRINGPCPCRPVEGTDLEEPRRLLLLHLAPDDWDQDPQPAVRTDRQPVRWS